MQRFIIFILHFMLQAVLLALVIIVVALMWLHTPPGSNWLLAEVMQQANSRSPYQITARGLGHGWPFTLSLDQLDVADQDGPFVTILKPVLVWHPLALLDNKLDIVSLSAQQADLLRYPKAQPSQGESTPTTMQFVLGNLDIAALRLPNQTFLIKIAGNAAGGIANPFINVTSLEVQPYALTAKGVVDLRDASKPFADLTFTQSDLSQLAPLVHQPLAGTLGGQIKLMGEALTLAVNSSDIALNNQILAPLSLQSDLTYKDNHAVGSLAFAVTAQTMPLTLNTAFDASAEHVELSEIKGSYPDGAFNGQLAYDLTTNLLQGNLAATSSNLAALKPLLPVDIGGTAKLNLEATVKDGAQSGRANIAVQNFNYQNWQVKSGNLSVEPLAAANSYAWAAAVNTLVPTSIDATAKGELAVNEVQKLLMSSFAGVVDGHHIKLLQPVTATRSADTLALSALRLTYDNAQLQAEGSLQGDNVDAKASWLNFEIPQAIQLGRAKGQIALSGTLLTPVINGDIAFAPQHPKPGQLNIVFGYKDGRADFTANYNQGTQHLLNAKGSLATTLSLTVFDVDTFKQSKIDATVNGRIPLEVLAAQELVDFSLPTGLLTLNINATGPLTLPVIKGSADLTNARYLDGHTGLELQDLTAHATFNGLTATITSLTATDGEGGKLSANGDISQTTSTLALTADRLHVLRLTEANAIASANLKLSGSLPNALSLNGDVTVHEAHFQIPERLPVSLVQLDYTQTGHAPRQPRVVKPASTSAPFAMALGITVNVPNRVNVEGRGLESELNGKLTIAGTSAAPDITGQLGLVRGSYEFLGKRFTLTKGGINFDGGDLTNPTLNLIAEQQSTGFLTRVTIGGPASKPEISYESEPSLPKDEIIARLLFGTGSAQLSPLQAIQLASALASLAGEGGNNLDITGNLRRGLGLDELAVVSDGTEDNPNNSALQVGKYLSDDVYLSTQQGLTPDSSKVGVEIRLSPLFSVESETGATGTSNLQLRMQKDY